MPATLETAKFDLTRDVWPLHFPLGTVRKNRASSPEHGLLFVGKAWQNSFNRAKSLGDWGFSRLRCTKFASKSEISLNFARNTSKPNMHSAVCWLLFARILQIKCFTRMIRTLGPLHHSSEGLRHFYHIRSHPHKRPSSKDMIFSISKLSLPSTSASMSFENTLQFLLLDGFLSALTFS